MEKLQVRFPPEEIERMEREVEAGRYPNLSEAVRDKVRKSYILEAMLEMNRATEGLDREAAVEALEETREERYREYKERSG